MGEVVHSVDNHSHYESPLTSLVYFLAGIISILLALRFVSLILGLERGQIVSFVYRFTQPIVEPFFQIFGTDTIAGSRIEFASLLAIVAVWIIAYIIAAIMRMFER